VRLRRRTTITLSEHEQRVLQAFYSGRLPAGRLSAALAAARSAHGRQPVRVRTAFVAPQPAAAEPAPLQLVA
jgi:hypothetical protein